MFLRAHSPFKGQSMAKWGAVFCFSVIMGVVHFSILRIFLCGEYMSSHQILYACDISFCLAVSAYIAAC